MAGASTLTATWLKVAISCVLVKFIDNAPTTSWNLESTGHACRDKWGFDPGVLVLKDNTTSARHTWDNRAAELQNCSIHWDHGQGRPSTTTTTTTTTTNSVTSLHRSKPPAVVSTVRYSAVTPPASSVARLCGARPHTQLLGVPITVCYHLGCHNLAFSLTCTCDGWNYLLNYHLKMFIACVCHSRHHEEDQVQVLITYARTPPQEHPVTFRKHTRTNSLGENTHCSIMSHADRIINCEIHVYFSSNHYLPVSMLHSTSRSGRGLRNTTMSRVQSGASTLTNGSTDGFEAPDDKDFPHFPFCSHHVFSSHRCKEASSFVLPSHVGQAVTGFAGKQFVYNAILFLTILYKCLSFPKSKKGKCNDSDPLTLTIQFTHSFAVRWMWEKSRTPKSLSPITQQQRSVTVGRLLDEEMLAKAGSMLEEISSSVKDTLNQYIIRPWLSKTQPGTMESSFIPLDSVDLSCSKTSYDDSTLWFQRVEKVLGPSETAIFVYPAAARFLPDPTRDPALDLAHVGYRLATLSTLSPTVLVSRVRLADAGFYRGFQGQGDEVTCFSCHVRHSDWSRGDNPMEIHRRLSPHCEYVLHKDREISLLASQSRTSGAVTNGRQRDDTRMDRSPDEDGESHQPPPPPQQPSPPPSQTTSFLHRTFDAESTTPRTENGSDESSSNRSRNSPSALSSATNSARVPQMYSPVASSRVQYSTTYPQRTSWNASSGVQNSITDPTRNSAPAASSNIRSCTSRDPQWTSPTTSASVQVTAGTDPQRNSLMTSSTVQADTRDPTRTSQNSSPSVRAGAVTPSRSLFPQARLDLGGAVYPMYQDMTSRRRSFTCTTWDDRQAPPLDDVILCGMFYAGYADCVRCFYCGVGLKHWVVTDDVWSEHVRWRPDCGYVRAVKGDNFVRDTQRRLAAESRAGEGADHSGRRRTTSTSETTNRNSSPPTQSSHQDRQPTTTSTTPAVASTLSTSPATTVAALVTTASPSVSVSVSPASTTSTASPFTLNTGQAQERASGVSRGPCSNQQTVAADAETEAARGERGSSHRSEPSALEEGERLTSLRTENRALRR